MKNKFGIFITFIFLILSSIAFYYFFVLHPLNIINIDGKSSFFTNNNILFYIFLPTTLSFALLLYAQKKLSLMLTKYNDISTRYHSEKQEYSNEIKSLSKEIILLTDKYKKIDQLKSEQHKELITVQSKYYSSSNHLVDTLTKIMELRDPYTAAHQKRVAILCVAIGEKMGWDKKHLKYLKIAALLHDIGKISIPTEILSKPRKLDPAEYELVQTHPKFAHYLLEHIDFEYPIADIINQHHENEDGSGYPNGLKGDEIHIEAKIINLANVIESITSHTPFHTQRTVNEALSEITSETNKKLFDEILVNIVVELFQKDGFTF